MNFLNKKIEIKQSDSIGEVVGMYPAGQSGLKKNEYIVEFPGASFRMTEAMLESFFSVIDEKSAPKTEPTTEPKQEKPAEKKAVKKTKGVKNATR